jgi:hypothetical protein
MKCAESMGVTQAFALIAELVMTKTLCEHHSYSTGKSAERDAILKAFGLDWKNLMKEAAEGKAKPAVDESKRPKSELKPPNGESNGHNNGTKAAKNGTGQSGAAVHFPDDPIAQARTHGAPALRPLRDLPLSSHVKQRALPALERYNIVSPQHCVNRMTNLGADMVYALKSIPGVSEENAAAITAAIAKLDLPVTVIIKDGRLPGQREEAMQGV